MSSGLPPVPNNKVTTRSKTSSFKRPNSMEVHDKKESRKLFSLFKTSSNNKINEDVNESNNNNNSFLSIQSAKEPKTNGPRKFEGRNFDSDEDYDLPDEYNETVVTRLAKQFDNPLTVMNDPAMTATLLRYLLTFNHDYKSLLFYLNVQYYQMMSTSKDFAKEAPKYITELFTTFLADNAILKLEHEVDIKSILDDLSHNRDLANIFEKSSNHMFAHCVHENVKKMRESILHGLYQPPQNLGNLNYDVKLSHYNDVIKEVLNFRENEMQKLNSNKNLTQDVIDTRAFLHDSLTAVKISLATIYHYYTKKEKDDIADNVSISSKGLGKSWMARSLENLQSTTFHLDKQTIFFSKSHKKGHSLFKKGKSIKGHYFLEKAFEYPTNCTYCSKSLWGVAPQGFSCSHCCEGVHKNCRDNVDRACQKIKTFQRNHSTASSSNNYNSLPTSNVDSGHNSLVTCQDDSKGFDGHDLPNNHIDHKDHSDIEMDGDEKDDLKSINSMVSSDQQSNIMTTSTTPSIHSNNASFSNYTNNSSTNTNQSFVSKTSIVISPTNNGNDMMSQSQIELESDSLSAMESNFSDNKNEKRSNVRNLANKFDGIGSKSISRSQSDENMEHRTIPRSSKRQSESVQVQDLVKDSTPWRNDKDMDVAETFEANLELENFPDHVSRVENKAEYVRLLVLMELHHKIKFIIMTLKRYDYLLIKRWPLSETVLFDTLSLYCIQPLYEVIKKLAAIFDSCKNSKNYSSDTASKLYDWLSDDNNMNDYLKYSMDLCCTNLLEVVKKQWNDARKNDPSFHEVLNRRVNKVPVVESLYNTKTLLCNLPLITQKVIKDLSKYSEFKREVPVWKCINEKLKFPADYIDTHCAPLVALINNGRILNGLDRSTWQNRLDGKENYFDFIVDFPKTIFNHKIFQSQEIKITNLRVNNGKQSSICIKETTDVYALCYDEMLVLLTKDNDRFVLKQFKSADTTKINPIFSFNSVHPSKPEKESILEISLVFIAEAVLTQLQFNKKSIMNEWYNFIHEKTKYKNKKNQSPASMISKPEQPKLDLDSNQKEVIMAHKDSHDSFMDKLKSAFPEDQTYIEPLDLTQFSWGTILDSSNLMHQSYSLIESGKIDETAAQEMFKVITNLKLRLQNFMDVKKSETASPIEVQMSSSPSTVSRHENIPEEQEDKDESPDLHESDQAIVCENEDLKDEEVASDKDQSDILYPEEIEPVFQAFENQSINSDQSTADFIEDFVESILADAKSMFNESSSSEMNNSTSEMNASSDVENNIDEIIAVNTDHNTDYSVQDETPIKPVHPEVSEQEDKDDNQDNDIHQEITSGHLTSISE